MKDAKDSMFALIEASQLSLNDDFMKHEPESDNQWELKKSLTEAIENGLSDFWAPKLDPSFSEDGTGLVFEADKMPAVGKSYNWWEEKAAEYLPERGSHLGIDIERVAFLGALIKKLIDNGCSVSETWYAVCDDSKELGHYWHSENAKHVFEPTGSREICGFCDLANTYKYLGAGNIGSYYCITGGSYNCNSIDSTLTTRYYHNDRNFDYKNTVGWIVLSK